MNNRSAWMILTAATATTLVCIAAPLDVGMGLSGNLRVGKHGAGMHVTVHHEGWKGVSSGVRTDFTAPDPSTGTALFELYEEERKIGRGRATLLATGDGRGLYVATITSEADQKPEAVVLSLNMPCEAFVGGTWACDSGKAVVFPKAFGNMCLGVGRAKSLTFADADGQERFTLYFPERMKYMIQDDRRWVSTFTLRLSEDVAGDFRKGDQRSFMCLISSPDGVNVTVESPVKISRGKEWIPLDYRKNIEAGSALDFSGMGLQDAPAGKYGWLKNVGGHFEFEGRPGVRQRFYGVNLCFSANFIDNALADELVTRLVRLGYNTVRIHHYENWNGVVKGSKDRLTINAEWMKRLDYLLYRAMEKGIYVTTDLFTSRPVMWRDVGIDRDGQVPMQVYKNLIAVHEPAFDNWKTFARNLLEHVNPYTGRRYADEPGLPLISLVNEGHLTWCWLAISKEPQMKAAWKKWLAGKRASDPSFAKGVSDDPEKVQVWSKNAALIAFMADLEAGLAKREREFLRSIGVKALLTSQNCGPHFTPLMAMREDCYDYVDDHFYVDHPHFIAKKWSLPSKCPNTNPVLSISLPPVRCAYTRMPSKPFCITEWNFSGPGMYRGVGGIMTGAMGALQEWDGLWRFAYSHNEDGLRDGKGFPGYFDVASDPLGQASDRASICLFLRRDMEPLHDRLALVATSDTFMPSDGNSMSVLPKWRDAAWQTQVCTAVAPVKDGVKTVKLGESRNDPVPPVPLSPNQAFALDRTVGSCRINTSRTAGGFTPEGALTAGPVSFDVGGVPATVWASSLDGLEIAKSKRLLVSHLTDVQADGNVYADKAKTTLLKWGSYPPLVRNGSAKVSLALASPDSYDVWSLATSGRRMERIPVSVRDGKLSFTATVEGAHGARMLYEVVDRSFSSP